MSVKSVILILLSLFFCSCGRQHPGAIINDTDETLMVMLKFNYPSTDYCTDNYFREEIVSNDKSKTSDYVVNFDSIKNTALLRLLPDKKIDLGTVRLGGGNRNNYRSWEFTEIRCKGDKGFKMHAKDAALVKYIHRNIFSNYTHSFVIR